MFRLRLFSRKKAISCDYYDPVDYNSTTRRLFRDGGYCVFTAGYCQTTTVGYNSTARRLYKMNVSTPQGQTCPSYVDYDTTNRRLRNYSGVPCGIT